jgi:hypothetical protein
VTHEQSAAPQAAAPTPPLPEDLALLPPPPPQPDEEEQLWDEFNKEQSEEALTIIYDRESKKILAEFSDIADAYCVVAHYAREDEIARWETDQIYEALLSHNAKRERDVLLVITSSGGQVDAAYHIARLCRAYARERFVTAIPREAKSAATLIALGADAIHMGVLSELGPIDPQVGRLPALGISQALRVLAEIAANHPKASTMIAAYLRDALTVAQIGYSQRICESAVQYAELLLRPRSAMLPESPTEIANHLVYALKDHGFVIDRDEAGRLLGSLVVRDSREVEFAERVYRILSLLDVMSWTFRKRLEVVGALGEGLHLWKPS